MNPYWLPILAGTGALVTGALMATAFWWWAAPRVLLMRWSAPLRDALDAGFSDQGLQYRLRAQADKLWARRQQALWRESLEQIHARHEACLLAEIRLLLRTAGQPAGGLTRAAPVVGPAPAAAPPSPSPSLSPLARQAAVVADTAQDVLPLALTDAQLDALAPEVPQAVSAGRQRPQAGTPPPAFKSI